MSTSPSLVGSIVERSSSSSSSSSRAAPKPPTASPAARATGFPAVHHRSSGKSVFAQARDGQRAQTERARAVPVVLPAGERLSRSTQVSQGTGFTNVSAGNDKKPEAWRNEMSAQNERIVSAMTDVERQEQRQEILERFGPDIGDVLRRAREQRLKQLQQQQSSRKRQIDEVSLDTSNSEQEREQNSKHVGASADDVNGSERNEPHETQTRTPSTPSTPRPLRPQRSILLTSTSRANTPPPVSRSSTPSTRKLRFAEVTPDDIYVYASQPPSPKRAPLLLPPPPPTTGLDDAPIVNIPHKGIRMSKPSSDYGYGHDDSDDDGDASKPLRKYFSKRGLGADAGMDAGAQQLEEGTPEDIRRRFFPHLPPRNPNLEWIEGPLRRATNIGARMKDPLGVRESSTEPTRVKRRPAPSRYDLAGVLLPPSEDNDEDGDHVHTHAHGHHHPSSSSTGQTLSNLCELTRSSVAAQRSSALDVLIKIVKRLRNSRKSDASTERGDGTAKEDPAKVRLRALNASMGVILGRGNLGGGVGVTIRAIELAKECIVGWEDEWESCLEWGWIETKREGRVSSKAPSSDGNDSSALFGSDEEDEADGEGLESSSNNTAHMLDPLSSIPLPFFLSRIESLLTPSTTRNPGDAFTDNHPLPTPSRSHILAIICTLAQYSRDAAHEILSMGALLRVVLDTFVATPVPALSNTNEAMDVDSNYLTLPDPLALRLLSTVAASARDNARSLVDAGVPDLLLRFVISIRSPSASNSSSSSGNRIPPTNSNPSLSSTSSSCSSPFNASPYPPDLSLSLFTGTLEFYTILAQYGMYARIATDATEWWGRLGSYVSEGASAHGFRTLSGRNYDGSGDVDMSNAQASSHSASKTQGKSETNPFDPAKLTSRTVVEPQSPNHQTWRKLTTAYLRLMQSWVICARDPHATTPPHEILWSQVNGWDWGDELLRLFECLAVTSEPGDDMDTMIDLRSVLFDTMAAWLEGCRLNEVRGGVEARGKANAIVGKGGVVQQVVNHVSTELEEELRAIDGVQTGSTVNERWRSIARIGRCLHAVASLCVACLPSGTREDDVGTAGEDTGWIKQVYEPLSEVALRLLQHNLLKVDTWDTDDNRVRKVALLKPLSAFLASFARLFHRIVHLHQSSDDNSARRWITLSTAILQRLLPGDEDDALWIMEELIKAWSSLPTPFPDRGFNTSCLVPFLAHAVRPKPDVRIASLSPSTTSIRYAKSLTLPASCASAEPGKADFGLPLLRDWPSVALDHLLRSGTSPVLEALPSSWNISEVEIVRATLSLIVQMRKAVVESSTNAPEDAERIRLDLKRCAMSAEETIFACMKVFMLEHDQQQDDSSEEVYRDTQVGNLMEEALRPFTYAATRDASVLLEASCTPSATLEAASERFLGTSTPFFQFYTDFVALYDAVSFSHKLFARLLLAPTGMLYALDYRKHLWGDFGHLLRGIRTPVGEILTCDLKSFLWPFETDGQMIGWYLRALVKFSLEGFVRLVAVHHVACNIWSDLQEGPVREKRAKMLLLAVVGQCKFDVVRDVVRYKQTPGGEIKLPPACFPRDGDWKEARLACVAEWGGIVMKRSLEKLFTSND